MANNGKVTDVLPTIVALGLTAKVVDTFVKKTKKRKKRKKKSKKKSSRAKKKMKEVI